MGLTKVVVRVPEHNAKNCKRRDLFVVEPSKERTVMVGIRAKHSNLVGHISMFNSNYSPSQ